MQQVFSNNSAILIPAEVPTEVSSKIQVSGLSEKPQRVTVTLDIDHTYTSDLRISLKSPDGKEVLLVRGEGGSGNNFRFTTFDDASRTSIDDALPPFSGSFRPQGNLSDFTSVEPNGEWVLVVKDDFMLDGGSLNGWTLSLTPQDIPSSNFEVQVNFRQGQFTANQRAVFEAAAQRWSEIILGDPTVSGKTVVSIDASTFFEGVGETLAEAGPNRPLRPISGLPQVGIMRFDRADLTILEANGDLFTTVFHEMCHVFGLGTLWELQGLLTFLGNNSNPVFLGANAMREFASLVGANSPQPVPVANRGGEGTFGGHWRESVFGAEAMTGFINNGILNPVSRMTIASLQDLGYSVNYNAAEPYVLPTQLQLSIMGITDGNLLSNRCTMCNGLH